MDQELLKMNESEHLDSLRKYVDTLTTSYISLELQKILWRNDGALVIQTLLNGLSISKISLEKKLLIAETILLEIETKQLPARVSEKLVNVLAGEVDSFPTSQLLRLVDVCCEMIRKPNPDSKFACWKELLPKLLHLVVTKPRLEHGGSQLTGEQYKNSVITSLCMADWSHTIIVDLAAMFIDMPMSKDERARVVRKLCSQLSSLCPEEIPPLAHQLLLLTKSENSMVFFLALANYFHTNLYDKMDKTASLNSVLKSVKEVSNVEGTVLYHVVENHGPSGMKEVLKCIRLCLNASQFSLQPFHITLLLAMSSVSQTCEDDVMATLRTGFARALLERERMDESAWLRTVCPPALDLNRVTTRVLENCLRGRDTVLKGLVTLGFCLLAAGRGSDGLHALGTTILEDLIKRNRLMTSIVLETLSNHISQATDSSQYTDCLIMLARKQPLSVVECTGPLLDLLQSCTRLPARTARLILTALLPLARLSHSVRDNLVIVLRKSLFPHDVERRIMSVSGFLELLRDLKISNLQTLSQSMSQNYCNFSQLCSQSLAGGPSQSNEGLCLEVLTVLREVFKHQHQVKTQLYKGIYCSVRSNPELGPHTLDYLQTHMEKYYVAGDSLPPINFLNAVVIQGVEAVAVEPLGDFILCLGLLTAKLEDTSRSAKLQVMLDSLSQRMAHCTISHFNLEPDGRTILESTPQAQQKLEILRQVLGVYEALMGYLLCSWNKGSSEKTTLFWDLFKGFTCLSDFAKGLGKTEKKKIEKRAKEKSEKGKTAAFKFPNTVLNFKCCARLLIIIHNIPVDWATEQSTVLLRGKRELHRYAVQAAAQVIKDARTLTPADLAKDCHSLGYLCSIGRTLFSKCVSHLAEMKAFDLPAALGGLQAFSDLLNLILSHFKTKFQNFLSEIAGEPLGSQNGEPLKFVLNSLLDQLEDVLAEDSQEEEGKEDQQAKKVPVLYLAVISCLVQQLPSSASYTLQVYEKIKTICQEKKIEKPTEAKALVALLLSLCRRCRESSTLFLDLALSLCDNMQLIDDDMTIEDHSGYNVINSRTANVCLVAMCDALMQQLADVEWTVNRLKAELVTLSFPTEQAAEERLEELRSRETELCRHVNMSVRILSGLCTLAVPPGVYSDSVLKTLETVYSRLSLLTKYFLTKVTKFQEDITEAKFDKTVRLVEAELTKNMYCFTEHVISDGTSDSRGVNPTLLKQRALKETKLIPRVVLEKEQYHKFLLILSKRAKLDLASKTKHALARDYRLYTRQVKELLENEKIEQETEEMEMEDSEEVRGDPEDVSSPPDSPVTKRRRSAPIADTNSQNS